MADDEEYHMDEDSDIDDDDDDEDSDDETGFFPIDEPIIPQVQSSTTAPITTTTTTTEILKLNKDQPGNKYSTGVNASNNYPQDNNFEYVGKCTCSCQFKFNLIFFSFIPR